jgi:hypothetical protein
MVKIEHSKHDLEQFAANHYAALCQAPYSLPDKLRDFAANAGTRISAEHSVFARLLTQHLQAIIVSWPSELETFKSTIFPAYEQVMQAISRLPRSSKKVVAARKKQYKEDLLAVFDYKSFTNNYTGYGAYQFTQNLGVNVCPYCNRQYTFTLDKKNGRTRPELDHFLDKATHPYFGLSFFNLVPSCHICNSNLKGSKTFTNDTYLNPYAACFNEVLHFSINVKTVDFINGKAKSFTITQKPVPGAAPELLTKAERNAKVFQHAELYSNHHDLVKELILKAYHYTPERKKELAGLTAEDNKTLLFQSEEEVNRFITGVYTEVADLGKRPMSKLIRDIGRELKLL